jgi:hypothetical protein
MIETDKEIKAKCSHSETISLHGPESRGYASSQRHTECKENLVFLLEFKIRKKGRRKKAHSFFLKKRKGPQNAGQQQKEMSAMRYRRCKKSMLHDQCSYNNTEKMDANRKTKTF